MFTYGIEIEVITRLSSHDIATAITAAGVQCRAEGYNHETRNHWKVVSDATVDWEIVSPILSGDDGHQQIEKVCEALQNLNVNISRSCGLHVHIGARDVLTVKQIKNVAKRYVKFERCIDSFMPNSRRATNSRWAGTMMDAGRGPEPTPEAMNLRCEQIDGGGGVSQLSFLGRDSKLNIAFAYQRHGTIEFRHHSGTIDAKKINNWVKFVMAFCKMAQDKPAMMPETTVWKTSTRRTRMLTSFFGPDGVAPTPELIIFFKGRVRTLAS